MIPVFKERDTWYECMCLENTGLKSDGNIALNLLSLQQLLWVKELLSTFLAEMPH